MKALDIRWIQREIDDLPIPYRVDLSIRRQITDPELLDHIRRVGVTFYKRTSRRSE